MGVAALKSVGFLVEARCGTPLNAYELAPEKVAMVVHQKDGQRSKISYLRLTPFPAAGLAVEGLGPRWRRMKQEAAEGIYCALNTVR